MALARAFVAWLLILGLTACQQGGMGGMSTGQALGTLGGATAGGFAGSAIGSGSGKLVAVGVGTLLGAVLGNQLGHYLDPQDQSAAARAEQQALNSNAPVTWNNPQSTHQGTVTPGPAYQTSSGDYCREYVHSVYIEGRAQDARGTACRQADGTWKLVS